MRTKGELIILDNNGKKKSIPYRVNTCVFNPRQLHFFFDNLVVRCENDIEKLKYFYINSKEIRELKKREKIEIIPVKKQNTKTIKSIDNTFVFLNDRESTIPSLLYHIRNAFVHNRIRILPTKEIELFDVDKAKHMSKKDLEKIKKKGNKRPHDRVTMYSRFSSFEKFRNALLGILKTQQ